MPEAAQNKADRIAALERQLALSQAAEQVREKALAMQTAQGLPTVSAEVFRQVQALDFKAINTAIGVIDEAQDLMSQWTILPADFPTDAADAAQAKVYEGGIRVTENLAV